MPGETITDDHLDNNHPLRAGGGSVVTRVRPEHKCAIVFDAPVAVVPCVDSNSIVPLRTGALSANWTRPFTDRPLRGHRCIRS